MELELELEFCRAASRHDIVEPCIYCPFTMGLASI